MTSLIIILICIIFSAFFSSAETAITSLGNLKAKHLIERRGKAVAHLKFWLDHPSRVLTTILVYNNIANILASALATEYSFRIYKSSAVGIATGIITFLVLIFGEIIPKSYAKIHFEWLAIVSLRIIIILYYISYPVIRLLSIFSDGIISISRSLGKIPDLEMTEEELEFNVKEAEKAGVIHEIKKDIIEGAFDFDETIVREIMTPRTDIKALPLDADIQRMINKAIETGYSRIPVYRTHMDKIMGIVLVKDLLRPSSNNQKITAKDLMRDALFAPESQSIMDVFKDLKRTKSHLAIIMDEHGGTAGLVTMEDILEEFVGEIQDEHDKEKPKIIKIKDNDFEVSGSTNLDDFKKYFSIKDSDNKDEQDIDTIGGLVTQLVGRMPKVGQKVTLEYLTLEVLKVQQHRIGLIKVIKSDEES